MIKNTLSLCIISVVVGVPAANGVLINEFMASNGQTYSDCDGDFSDWIELYNSSDEIIALAGYYLSDDSVNPLRWQVPEGNLEIAPGGHFLIWASGKDKVCEDNSLHTNFSISRDGEPLLLSTPDGVLVDVVPSTYLARDVSYGRKPDGSNTWLYFVEPTPEAANATSGYSGIMSPVQFSHEPGYYTAGFYLEMSHPDDGAAIYYSLDGSTPTPSSAIFYESPVWVDSRVGQPNTISMIPAAYLYDEDGESITFLPQEEVFKISVVRAAAFREGYVASQPITQSFLVDSEINNRYHVPVVSLVTDADNLFDDTIGIYVPGDLHENIYPDAWMFNPANYLQRGIEWERPVHISFFEPGGVLGFAQDGGIRIHGGWTRAVPQKSLRLYARTSYGKETFEYPFFGDDYTQVFKRFLLRNTGCDIAYAHMRDALIQGLAIDIGLDQQGARTSVVFINGEYWGVYNIRERLDKYYLHYRHGVDPENIDLLTEYNEVKEGDAVHYTMLLDYVDANDMSCEGSYSYVQTLMDTENYLDYYSVQIFAANHDWPFNNIDFWRLRTDGYLPDAPFGHDGRWRWILFDLDDGFGMGAHYSENTLAWAAAEDFTYGWMPYATKLFRALLDNETFRHGLINRLADHMNTIFREAVVVDKIIAMRDERLPLMQEQFYRWNIDLIVNTVEEWLDEVDVLIEFAMERPQYVRQHVVEYFDLPGTATIAITPVTFNHGSIRINTIEISDSLEGWEGVYFQGVPIEIEARPGPGYVFAGWDGLPESTPALTEIVLDDDLGLTAHFTRTDEAALIHYWNFNESSAAPSYTVGGGLLNKAPGLNTVFLYDDGQGFSGVNARFDDVAGNHLRVNYPLGASLTFYVPTTGYEDIVFAYETRRSGQGAGIQRVYYTLDGAVYVPYISLVIHNDYPVLHTLHFWQIEGVDNNPDFAVRIEFEQGAGGVGGNNRFDNVTVESVSGGVNLPPELIAPIGLQQGIEQGPDVEVLLDGVFSDPEGDPIGYEVVLDKAGIATAILAEELLRLKPLSRGELRVTVLAYDGHNPPVSTDFRLLVYPEPHPISEVSFSFDAWSPDEPDGAYPEHMLFLQSAISDPGPNTPLEYAYHIPHDDYNDNDLGTIGFPYNNTRRTRINGLGDEGVSFINTGRGRDLGGALLALDTTGVTLPVMAQWLCGTILRNQREYAIRLQYRVGHEAPFQDIVDKNGNMTEYLSKDDGDTQIMGPIALPESLLDKPYVQLLWRYYHVSGNSGPRAELRLDDINLNVDDQPEGEGEGEHLDEGEGEHADEGEGEHPDEGEGEHPDEGEGEHANEGEGEPYGNLIVDALGNTNYVCAVGKSVTFEVFASGYIGEPHYQWYRLAKNKSGVVIVSAEYAAYTIESVTFQDEGAYQCEVSDDTLGDAALSPIFTLSVVTAIPVTGSMSLIMIVFLTAILMSVKALRFTPKLGPLA